jgi:hypothetical protein
MAITFRCAAFIAMVTGCGLDSTTGSVAQNIDGPYSDASAWQRVRAVAAPIVNGCTATKIAPNFIISAAHCGFTANETVAYYSTSPVGAAVPSSNTAKITNVHLPPGVVATPDENNKTDTAGLFADYVILELDRADTYGEAATLAWTYPGSNASGQKVGRGEINGNANPSAYLLQVADTTASTADGDGSFWTSHIRVDHGDSGGPFYVGGRVLGLDTYYVVGGTQARYVSIPAHLDWILTVIAYRWSGATSVPRYYSGTMLEAFWATEKVCQYACDSRSDCEAYDYFTSIGQCQLMSNVNGTSYNSGVNGALHYAGARSSNSGGVVGYARSTGVDAVVRGGSDGQIHELRYENGQWLASEISGIPGAGGTGQAPAPSSALTAYRRSDGSPSVLYRSGNQLIETNLQSYGWRWFQFPLLAGTTPVGNPAAYVRGDGVGAVLYRTSAGHIVEVTETLSPFWTANDLTAAIPGAPLAAGDPTAYLRSDGVSSVLFRSADNQIFELYMSPDHHWDWGEPSVLAGAPAATSNPRGYVMHQGTNSIVYSTTGGRVEALTLDGAGWHGADITGGGASSYSDPVPYVRTDATETVDYYSWVYGQGGQIWELTNVNPWTANNLTTLFGTGSINSLPSPFVGNFGWDEVPYDFGANHVGVLEHQPGSTWYVTDLTLSTGETP